MIFERQVDVKAPRACELCLQKQAVWYCASDDAFLCQSCDVSVHSANQVAIKHERVCLKTNETPNNVLQVTTSRPVWHSGFRRKARTSRIRYGKKPQYNIDERREDPRVPEIGGTGMFYISEKNNDDDLTSLVPEFQGFFMTQDAMDDSLKLHTHLSGDIQSSLEFQEELEKKTLRTDTEEVMKQFNFEEEVDAMEDLYYNEDVKTNGDEVLVRIGNNLSCPEQSLMTCRKGYEKIGAITDENGEYEANLRQRNMLLRLNYEDVIAAWDKQGSPSNFQLVPPGMDCGGGAEEKRLSNRSEREARVWRYRDKRKTRLFQKKIRYEVRKVNADKRPRMKGRFVRRSIHNDCS